MFRRHMLLVLFSQSIIMYGAADAPRLTLLDCYDQKIIACPGASMPYAWMAYHTVRKVAELRSSDRELLAESLTPDTTKILRCCIGSVESKKRGLIEKVKAAVLQDLHPKNIMWVYPFDLQGTLDMKEFISDAHVTSRAKARLSWFRCSDDRPVPYQKTEGEELRDLLVILPNSLKSTLISESFWQYLEEAVKKEDSFAHEAFKIMLQRKELNSDILTLLDAYVRGQGTFHEAPCLVLNVKKFAAFAVQEFEN